MMRNFHISSPKQHFLQSGFKILSLNFKLLDLIMNLVGNFSLFLDFLSFNDASRTLSSV